ncbi:hypothetical protein [Octadecabacter antarcticus]|uniref:hypothetical protein n=1 Tax=Octadecabacter antarcticus TaxID=1217908 RepID=UPI0001806A6C|nr:hypothetical protein [Octadecabacter antarcticus]
MAYFKAFHDSSVAEVHLAALPGGAAMADARVIELTDLSMLRQVSCRNAAAAIDGGGAARITEAIGAGLAAKEGKEQT